ncbi:MAG: restriction endonuclease [Candidatus Omnitrophica bacterium]|nr:restriction endonuclease [Candidatus Omnitrophota bacterium]
MQLQLNLKLAAGYKSPSQKIRVMTEAWVDSQVFCPSCGYHIDKYGNNKPVADFFCRICKEEYELKSKKAGNINKIVNGAYNTMINRLQSNHNPNFFLLNYNLRNFEVFNFFVIPKYFFVPDIIEKRKPLSNNARRRGWVGCNILLQDIPQSGKIFFVKNRSIQQKREVLGNWNKTLFLKEEKEISAKGWILDIMKCIDKLNKKEFSLNEIYSYEKELRLKYPKNRHIKDKIRQQLQFLRDKGYLTFLGKGRYKVI